MRKDRKSERVGKEEEKQVVTKATKTGEREAIEQDREIESVCE